MKQSRKRVTSALAATMCVWALAAIPATAYAQDDDAKSASVVNDLSNRGIAKYRAEEYDEAIELFKQAYEIEPVPNLLYNIARCYEKQREYEQAIKYYEEFVVSPDVESDDRQKALTRTEKLREVLKAQNDVGDGNKGNGSEGNGGTGNGNTGTADKGKKGRGPAFAVLGVGVAGLATGGVFGYLANQNQTAFNDATSVEDKRTARDAGKRQALIADISLGTGAIVTVVGIVMVARRGGEESSATLDANQTVKKAPRARVNPWFGRDGGGLSMSVRF